MNYISVIIVILFSVILTLENVSILLAQQSNPGILASNTSPYGTEYSDWIGKWWQWNIALPKETHLTYNYSADNCDMGQVGPVWFLAGVVSGRHDRSCTIPSDKAVLLPLETGECDYGEKAIASDSDLVTCATEGNDYAVISASVDGNTIKDPLSYRTQSGFFNISVPSNNIFEEPPGVYKAYADGYFLFIEPLSPGEHVVKITSNINNPFNKEYSHSKDLTYRLNVINASR